MAGMNCFAAADFFSSSSDSAGMLYIVLKKLRGCIYQIYFEKWQSEHEREHQTFSVSWKEPTWQVCIVLLVGSASEISPVLE